MRLIIRNDAPQVGNYIGDYIVKRIKEFTPSEGHSKFVLGLPTGSSPIPVYQRLIELYKQGEISFKDVITFNMDEYVGLDRNHPESYHSFMHREFFSQVDIQPENVNILNGEAEDLLAECDQYEAKIKAVGGIDLFLGGIGPDGHIAFNEPGSSLKSRTRVKTLAYETIQANSRFFGNDINKVPHMALTVGVATVLDAREIVLVITGQSKSWALAKSIEEGVNHLYTVSAIQMHPWSMIVCDEDATLDLRVKTVRYFKSIEKVQNDLEEKYGCAALAKFSIS